MLSAEMRQMRASEQIVACNLLRTQCQRGRNEMSRRSPEIQIFHVSCPRLSCSSLAVARGPERIHPESTEASTSAGSLVLPVMGADADWRAFRARLVSSSRPKGPTSSHSAPSQDWAHSLPGPEKGCLLLAHPALFSESQTYFFRRYNKGESRGLQKQWWHRRMKTSFPTAV